ncbi:MAG: tRNA (N(6)-L-threonylcarbamoyladenosine(37)-C(2))-methylthiotransferase MtaB [Pirellulales bacterium]|nr:tRNA (N(6)-L-threonylcarbamoyladenosine(37)-C(2))-methylthiotransferase MtaB [Pirellulales bacterium]
MPALKIVTLGCKVNQYESEYAREGFAKLGFCEVGDGENGPVELIVVNTCTVTAESEAKCRKIIRRLAKKHPAAEIVVLGCYAARAPDEAARLPGVSEVVPDKRDLPDLLKRRGLSVIPDGISSFEGRHRAWVKVQDGCRQHCSYCIVPLVRPRLSSRPVEEALAEIGRLHASGFAEIVLTGIHLGHYGLERPEPRTDLAGLVEKIVALPGDFRVRFSSIEAAEVTPELLRLMADRPDRICPHLHLPLQSGSDAILEKMNRRGSAGRFIECCRQVRQRLVRAALTTDAIVGFPGETEEDFAATCRAVEEAGMSKVHVFRFSPRQGTPAATLKNRVPQRVHQHWAAQLNRLSDRLRAEYLRSLVGGRVQVLIEGVVENSNRIQGTADRYITVELEGDAGAEGRLIDVRIEATAGDRAYGTTLQLPNTAD